MPSQRPAPPSQQTPSQLPAELTSVPQWHCWNLDHNGNKIPKSLSGWNAKSNDPTTWSDYQSAFEASQSDHYQGLAFEITDPWTGIDLDYCLSEKGILQPWALPIISRFDGLAYAEISPSGRGIKLITRARKPDGAKSLCKIDPETKQQIECYDNRRFWTITHQVFNGQDEIGDGQHVVDWLCETYLSKTSSVTSPQTPSQTSSEPSTATSNDPVVQPIGSPLYQRGLAYVETCDPALPGDRNNHAFRICGQLRSLDDLGMRLNDEQVTSLIQRWNFKNPDPLDEDEILKLVDSSARNGTLPQTKPRTDPAIDSSIDPEEEFPGLMSLEVTRLRSISQPPPPEDLTPFQLPEIPGLITDIIKHNLRTARYPLPELALAGALALMSTVTAGKVSYERTGRTNIYVIGLAPSGGGKDHSRQINRDILQNSGHEEVVGPERIGSHAGIITALSNNWRSLFQIDEIGKLLATTHSATRSPHLYAINSVLMQLYTSAHCRWQGDAYGDAKKVKTLAYPHCVLYGVSVPSGFWENIDKGSMSDGFMGRFLLFEHPGYVDYQRPKIEPIPDSILERATHWLDFRPGPGNMSGDNGADPKELVATPEAAERLHQHAVDISNKRKNESEIDAAMWSRHAEKTTKLAMLFAASRFGPDEPWPEITFDDADKAVRLNNWLTRRMLYRAGLNVAENETEKAALRMLRIIGEKPEWTRSALMKRLRWLAPRMRNDLLSSLIENEEVISDVKDTGGRPVHVFRKA